MVERVYSVPGVNCEHCVNAINKELSQIEGIQKIDVDLQTKKVKVQASESVPDERIRAGIDEAGFDIAG
jgi:copper chaperone